MIGIQHYIIVSAILFVLGVLGIFLNRKNVIVILMAIELILLAVNITLAIVVLLTAIQVQRALDFSVFPSLLLITTLFRLALNVSTTRLILLNGADGEAAAGEIVAAVNPDALPLPTEWSGEIPGTA